MTSLVLASALASGACDPASTAGPDGGVLNMQHTELRMLPGDEAALTVTDGAGHDVTLEATWSVGDAPTATVQAGRVSAGDPGITWIRAEYRGAVDSARVVVSFASAAKDVSIGIRGVLSTPLELTGNAFWHDRLESSIDHTTILATPGTFDPGAPPGIDFVGEGSQLTVSLGSGPEIGSQQLQSWTVALGDDGGVQLHGPDGVAVWWVDPTDPSQAELYVSVGTFDLEIDRVDRPEVHGLPSGELEGRVAFDAAGLVVDLTQGAPTVVGQIGSETVRVFAEFRVALRVFPIGAGTFGVDGGSMPLALAARGAPEAGRYGDGLIIDYSLSLPGADGSIIGLANQIWLGSPATGEIALEAVGPEAIGGSDAYDAVRAWAWSAHGTDIQAVFRGDGDVNAFSSGGVVRVTSYRPAGDEVFGQIEGEFEIPETVYDAEGAVGGQTIHGTFVAPILPHSLAGARIVPPSDIPTPEPYEPDPWRPTIGDGSSRIYGTVLEDGLVGVEGFEVRISGPAGSGTAITNGGGSYAFEGLTTGDYDLELVVSDDHLLAFGQSALVTGFHVEEPEQRRLDLGVSDAEGNGSLTVMTVESGTSRVVDSVRVTVRPEDGGPVAATLVSGDDGPGRALAKLQPGRYRLEVEPPDGYVLDPTESEPVVVQIARGRHWLELLRLAGG